MGCCSSFSAVTSATTADPARHVNFTVGMVLGVDDYRQEFAYHAAREMWIVRDLLGYGTLSGLAVSLEDTAQGPRVRVTPGSAAAPSGQLICVGREQCGTLNAWLARAETKQRLDAQTAGMPAPIETSVNLFLTLCYVDCAVAEVPIPGEPCRSDENLMAPSRIADDYVLQFAFDPPPMREAQAVRVLDALWTGVTTGAGPGISIFQAALDKAKFQLRLALGLVPADAPAPPPADLTPIDINGETLQRFRAAIKRYWVTELRPALRAASAANHCVMLARLHVPLIKPGADWQTAGVMADLTLDQSDRPLLLSGAITQSGFGGEIDAIGTDRLVFLTADGAIATDAGVAVVIADAPIEVTLPQIGTAIDRAVMVRAGGDGIVTLAASASDKIDGDDTVVLPARGCVLAVADRDKSWQIVGIAP